MASYREALQTLINKHKLVVDRSVFSKTADEKLAFKEAKKKYKKSLLTTTSK